MRLFCCAAILTFCAPLFADDPTAKRDIRHLGQTSFARATALHRIDSADIPQKPRVRSAKIEPRQPLTAIATQNGRSTPYRPPHVRQVGAIRRQPLRAPTVVIPTLNGDVTMLKNDSARIDFVLKRWEAASQQTKTAECEITRWVYDNVFEVDKRAVGRLAYIEGSLLVIDIERIQVDPKSLSRKIGSNGRRFKVESAPPESWIFSPDEIRIVDHVSKTMDIIPLPHLDKVQKFEYPFAFFGWPLSSEGAIPFVFHVSADDFKKRFDISITKEEPKSVTVLLHPVESRDRANFSEALVKLDAQTYMPIATKVTDPSGNLDTVYLFANWKVSDKIGFVKDIPIANKRYFGYKRNVLATSKPDAANAQAARRASAQKPLGMGKVGLILPNTLELRWWTTGKAAIELASARPITAVLLYAAAGERKSDESK